MLKGQMFVPHPSWEVYVLAFGQDRVLMKHWSMYDAEWTANGLYFERDVVRFTVQEALNDAMKLAERPPANHYMV